MKIKTVTVVGANGTMGANVSAIFASFGNATVYIVSRDKEKVEECGHQSRKVCEGRQYREPSDSRGLLQPGRVRESIRPGV